MLFSFLEKTNKITIITHTIPDLDTLCSAKSLYNILNRHMEVELVCSDIIPNRYQEIINYKNWKTKISENSEKVITLDCSNWERTGVQKPEKPILNIDHHETNKGFGDYNYVIKNASSTCEMLAEIFQKYNLDISEQSSTLLLTGIFDDTDKLQHPNVTQKTLKICSFLLKK